MLEQEMAELSERLMDGSRGMGGSRGAGWSLMVPVWDAQGDRVLGCLRVECAGSRDGADIVSELEESPFAQ